MNRLRQLVVFFTLIGFSFGSGNAAEPKPKTKFSPQNCTVRFKRFYKEFSNEYAEFTLTNATAHSVWFAGYSLDSPLFKVQILKDGQWENEGTLWCGTGVDSQKLRSHQSTTFRVPICYEKEWNFADDKLYERKDKPKTMRVGVSCSPQKDFKGEKTYWSEKVVPLK